MNRRAPATGERMATARSCAGGEVGIIGARVAGGVGAAVVVGVAVTLLLRCAKYTAARIATSAMAPMITSSAESTTSATRRFREPGALGIGIAWRGAIGGGGAELASATRCSATVAGVTRCIE